MSEKPSTKSLVDKLPDGLKKNFPLAKKLSAPSTAS